MEHIVEINFNNKNHCDLIIVLAKLNKFYVEDLEILVCQKLPTLNDIAKTLNLNVDNKCINSIYDMFIKDAITKFYSDDENYKGYLLFKNNKAIGFLIYYNSTVLCDILHFLLIDKTYINKGYGTTLLNYFFDKSNKEIIKIKKPSIESITFYKKLNCCELKDLLFRLNIKDNEPKYKRIYKYIGNEIIENIECNNLYYIKK